VGYYSLASSCIERDVLGSIASLSGLPRFSVPAILLARLAVHEDVQKRGVGVRLFADALKHVERAAALVGIRLLLTDAKDNAAMAYYESVGLLGVQSSGFPRRMVLDLKKLDPLHTA
jgi:GNAT superfamily N-acetyltransferase